MKICGKCKQEKTLEDFSWKSKAKGIRSSYCKWCNKAYQRQHYSDNVEYYKGKSSSTEEKRARVYGLTVEQLNELLQANNGLCLICNTRKATHIDHCHITGAVRGALCSQCNHGLGNFKDNVEWLQNAIAYLAAVYPHSDKV